MIGTSVLQCDQFRLFYIGCPSTGLFIRKGVPIFSIFPHCRASPKTHFFLKALPPYALCGPCYPHTNNICRVQDSKRIRGSVLGEPFMYIYIYIHTVYMVTPRRPPPPLPPWYGPYLLSSKSATPPPWCCGLWFGSLLL